MAKAKHTSNVWPSPDSDYGPLASPQRAAEIALMEKFDLAEFIELTGGRAATYGIYHVTREGVSITEEMQLQDFRAKDQLQQLQAEKLFYLKFPCEPSAFMTWYDATRGLRHPKAPSDPGVSDFPLADGFIDALGGGGKPSEEKRRNAVPSARIMAAFRKERSDPDNFAWWNERMRQAKKYKLTDARVSKGRAGNPSRWDPLLVAYWLIEKNHMPPDRVRQAFAASFPGLDSTYL